MNMRGVADRFFTLKVASDRVAYINCGCETPSQKKQRAAERFQIGSAADDARAALAFSDRGDVVSFGAAWLA
jgi:hypothetical protein